jgi:uncharacterized membrane-anchored protein
VSDSDPTDRSPEDLVRRFKDLVARFDAELRKAGLTDEQREQLVHEVMEDGNQKQGTGGVGD